MSNVVIALTVSTICAFLMSSVLLLTVGSKQKRHQIDFWTMSELNVRLVESTKLNHASQYQNR